MDSDKSILLVRLVRTLCVLVIVIMGLGNRSTAQELNGRVNSQIKRGSHLYLVAGTSSIGTSVGTPTTLYDVDGNGRLRRLRSLLPAALDGADYGYWVVRRSEHALYVVSNQTWRTTILHFDDPMRQDLRVVPVPSDETILQAPTVVVSDKENEEALLVATANSSGKTTTFFMLPENSDHEEAAGANAQSEYAAMLFYGTHGGGEWDPGPVARLSVNVVFTGPMGDVPIDRVPSSLRVSAGVYHICIADHNYLIISRSYVRDRTVPNTIPANATLYIHDKRGKRWNTLELEGNSTLATQVFNSWLAYTVGTLSFDDRKPGPNRSRERGEEIEGRFPSVQDQYRALGVYNPGILILQNMEDHRLIKITTGQEDSEILYADDRDILYRVNDAVFQAPIAGNKLGPPVLVVKGSDIPEVHWVFFHN